MTRARNIKPGFFKNELLAGLPFEFRLLFVGIWTMADREGRFEDRPQRIRMELFAADNVDVEAGLQALHDNGFVERYEIGGNRYCQILAWKKHQNPHTKECASSIPAPRSAGAILELAPYPHSASTMLPPGQHGSDRADSLIPDSGFSDSSISVGKSPVIEKIPVASTRATERSTDSPSADASRTEAVQITVELRSMGFGLNPSNPDLVALIARGVGKIEILDTAREVFAKGKTSFGYVATTIRNRRAEASQRGPPKFANGKRGSADLTLDYSQVNYDDGQPASRPAGG